MENNTNLEDLVVKVLKESFDNGTIEAKFKESLDNCIDKVIKDMFGGWNSNLKKELENRLEPVMLKAISGSSFEGYIDKLALIINQCAEIREIAKVVELSDSVMGKKCDKIKSIKLSEIFEKYNKWVEDSGSYIIYDGDELEFDEGYAHIYLSTELDEFEENEDKEYHWYYRNNDKIYTLTTKTQNDDIVKDDDIQLDIKFKLHKGYDGKYNIMLDGNLLISDLRHMPSFLLFLYQLQMDYTEIIIDKTYITEEVCIEIKEDY